MDIKTGNGMGLKPKGISWKPNYGMGLQKNNGMGLKRSNGMGLTQDNNYFKFNEYERKKKYFQMGSGKPSEPKPRPEPKPKAKQAPPKPPPPKKQPEPKPEPAAEVQAPKQTTQFNARQKWGAAATAIVAAKTFSQSKKAEVYVKPPSPEDSKPPSPGFGGNSTGSVMRTMSLFEQLLFV
ncbi:hypothetical protein PoB_006046800 [Plakobranchus ocellatus]|uniref:G-patch domain-containing protein n=1 Tax=Plakobranchus ocellatus TaxID=259542 RepID=A0AAV4CQ07_9GAST|nr:hypothetical protein PoB_006046800 [Plakobranchus ocellatus]